MNEPAKRITDGPPEESGAVSRPFRKPKHSVWLSLVVATAAFPCVFVLVNCIVFVVCLLYLITFKPYGPESPFWESILFGVIPIIISVYISLRSYRRFRWGKVAASRDGDAGHALDSTESKHSTCEGAGQTSMGHGVGTGQ